MSDSVRHSISNTVIGMLGHPDDSCRVVAAACLGTLCEFLPEDEFEEIVHENLLGKLHFIFAIELFPQNF